ncbi:hypothetical protein GJ629_01700 [Halapricum sp. CBA1109]|uniref:hypothetical protein n=1 Tax=Halapricum sp. CBA1109 TaxID=2668068 RepID=UPI0012F75D18|nr:hypothetical protein [Halapricum sp. CBA1109]MUV88757.1 hypothetical protein [Halapricum sp. CBA1109]
MLDRSRDDGEKLPSPYRTTDSPGTAPGEIRVCEICGNQRRCFDRFDMITCQSCQDTYLPSKGLLL